MCGLASYSLALGAQAEPEWLQSARACLTHRGPKVFINIYGNKRSVCIKAEHDVISSHALWPENMHVIQMFPNLLNSKNQQNFD